MRRQPGWSVLAALLLLSNLGGCPRLLDALEELEIEIENEVDVIQRDDPRNLPLPVGATSGDTIIITGDIIIDISEQLVVEELPDITLVGLENLTGYDIFLEYFADDALESALILSGETLFIEYPCLDALELISERDFDPFDGFFVDEFDLSGFPYFNGIDFFCGEAIIITITPDAIDTTYETIDL
ncbi:MAG TPA: hypothetical protein VM487_11915 [Phycisphaerae bacterium]|nr:hypothetical protein [Phycisphaerae bacterium]